MIATNNEVAAWLCLSRAILALLETEEQLRSGSQVHERLVNAMKHLNLYGGHFPGIEGVLVEEFTPEAKKEGIVSTPLGAIQEELKLHVRALDRIQAWQNKVDKQLGELDTRFNFLMDRISYLEKWQISMDSGRKAAAKRLEEFKFDELEKRE